MVSNATNTLPKRSTLVDQTFWSESTHSQLSVAIFRALRNRLGAQKSLMYFQTCQKDGNPCIPPPRVSKTRDISRQNVTRGRGVYGLFLFWHVWNYIRPFWVTRRFLRAIKIATESWECVLSYQKVWSTRQCWPFRQHFDSILTCTCPNKSFSHFAKSDGWSMENALHKNS